MEWLIGTAAVIAAIVGIGKGIAEISRFFKKINNFIDDFAGEPARDGVAARPGVMARLERIEHEVTTNSGTSIKDAVKRIEANQEEMKKHLGGNPA